MADEMMEDEGMEESETETALLPKSFFQGKDIEVGKKCEIKVEGVFDDEIEVSYVKHKKDGKDSDSDDDDKPKRRRESRDGEMMDTVMRGMDEMAGPPAMGGY